MPAAKNAAGLRAQRIGHLWRGRSSSSLQARWTSAYTALTNATIRGGGAAAPARVSPSQLVAQARRDAQPHLVLPARIVDSHRAHIRHAAPVRDNTESAYAFLKIHVQRLALAC